MKYHINNLPYFFLLPFLISSSAFPSLSNYSWSNDNSCLSIEDAVRENSHLDGDEKRLLLEFQQMIDDNPNLNQSDVYDNLSDVNIIYQPKELEDSTIIGMYYPNKNQIRIFEDDWNHYTLIHELIHCIYSNEDNRSLPVFFQEGVTELLANEYFTDNPFLELDNYPFEVVMVKMLCEMVGEDIVLEVYTTGDEELLIQELSKSMGTIPSKIFMSNLDEIFQEYKNNNIPAEVHLEVLQYLDSFYSNSGMHSDIYTYNRAIIQLLGEEYPNVCYLEFIMENGYYEKYYFVQNEMNDNSEIIWKDYDEYYVGKVKVKKY